MKPIIPKEIKAPALNQRQIEELTNIVFLPEMEPVPCDAIFIFGGTHPGHWEKAIEAYKKGYGQKIIITGGVSPTGVKHPDWNDQNEPEANVIVSKLTENGIKQDDIVFENQSQNTLENVLFAKEVFDFSTIESLLFVGKNHAAGRQYRTLAQHLPKNLQFVPFGFDAHFHGYTISRNNWMYSETGRARVLGEYLRIIHYGKMGHLLPLEKEVENLEFLSNQC